MRIVVIAASAALFLSGAAAGADQCTDLIDQSNGLHGPPPPAFPAAQGTLGSCQHRAALCAYARASLDYAHRMVDIGHQRLAMIDPLFNACAARGRVVIHTWGERMTRAEARSNAQRDLDYAQNELNRQEKEVADSCDPKRLTTGCIDDAEGL